jgi:hypothetical protein
MIQSLLNKNVSLDELAPKVVYSSNVQRRLLILRKEEIKLLNQRKQLKSFPQ